MEKIKSWTLLTAWINCSTLLQTTENDENWVNLRAWEFVPPAITSCDELQQSWSNCEICHGFPDCARSSYFYFVEEISHNKTHKQLAPPVDVQIICGYAYKTVCILTNLTKIEAEVWKESVWTTETPSYFDRCTCNWVSSDVCSVYLTRYRLVPRPHPLTRLGTDRLTIITWCIGGGA